MNTEQLPDLPLTSTFAESLSTTYRSIRSLQGTGQPKFR